MSIDDLPNRVKEDINRMIDLSFTAGLWLGFVLGVVVVLIYNLFF